MIKLILPSLFVTFSLSQILHAKIYKWTDSTGNVTYSATPPKDTKTQAQNIEEKIKFNIGKVPSATPLHALIKVKKERNTKATQPELTESQLKARLAYCNGLKQNIQTLEASKETNITDGGSQKTLSSTEKLARLTKDKKSFKKSCSNS